MKRLRPSPALVISLFALFVALGGTSYAAITSLPKNSVGTPQLKNGAVAAAKLNRDVSKSYVMYGGALPAGKTEVGVWGHGDTAEGGAGAQSWPVFTFPVPLAKAVNHAVAVNGSSGPHCPGAGRAAPGYLCVYVANKSNTDQIHNFDIFNPETPDGGNNTAGAHGFAIFIKATTIGAWNITGTYAVTAPAR
jgi:hypothetical protein